MNHQPVAISWRPNQTFFIGGLQFPVYGTDSSLFIDVNQAAIQAMAAPIGGALHHPQINSQAFLLGQGTDRVELALFYANGLLEI